MARIHAKTLKELLHRVLNTRKEEIGCETCFDSLDRFVELELEGKDAAQALPLIQRHLDVCGGATKNMKPCYSH